MRSLFLHGLALTVLTANAVSAAPLEEFSDADAAAISSAKSMSFGTTFGSICGCTLLSLLVGRGKVFVPGTGKYTEESTTKFWSQTSWNTPRCVFVPTSANDVAKGIKIMGTCQAEFAIRGGGHMPIPNFTNTDDGILFALSGLETLSLSEDKSSLFVGPSHNWGQVYNFLGTEGLYVLGGRLSPVGVPGLLLGGGINFFSNKYGLAADNVLSYEVVLANGDIVTATANSYSDLFWALKGGSSNFGIVTKFQLKTYRIPTIWTGLATFAGDENFNLFYSALVNLANSNYTAKGAGTIAQINYQPPAAAGVAPLNLGVQVLVHEGDVANPPIFDDFAKVQALQYQSMTTPPALISDILGAPGSIPGTRHTFHVQSSLATLEATEIVNSTFYGLTAKLAATVPSLASAGIAFQPIPASTIDAGRAAGGNALGIKTGQNFFWYAMSVNWNSAADDVAAEAWIAEVGAKMLKGFKEKNIVGNDGREYLYMNDAQGGQDVFAGYGPAELARLKTVRQKYDKNGKMFGKNGLSKGGFKF